jgi:hypothetical protein
MKVPHPMKALHPMKAHPLTKDLHPMKVPPLTKDLHPMKVPPLTKALRPMKAHPRMRAHRMKVRLQTKDHQILNPAVRMPIATTVALQTPALDASAFPMTSPTTDPASVSLHAPRRRTAPMDSSAHPPSVCANQKARHNRTSSLILDPFAGSRSDALSDQSALPRTP